MPIDGGAYHTGDRATLLVKWARPGCPVLCSLRRGRKVPFCSQVVLVAQRGQRHACGNGCPWKICSPNSATTYPKLSLHTGPRWPQAPPTQRTTAQFAHPSLSVLVQSCEGPSARALRDAQGRTRTTMTSEARYQQTLDTYYGS